MSTGGIYETIKTDLAYLKMNRTREVFTTLADEARQKDWTHLEFLARLLAEETEATRTRRLQARLRFAHFPAYRTIEEFDFEFQPSVDRKQIHELAEGAFIEEGRPVLFLGQPGCGKTHLACAIAIRAVEAGYRGYFTNADDMVGHLAAARADGTFTTKIRTYTGPSVLVIDDVGITPIPREGANLFYQVVNRRYEIGSSTIVTTNRGLPAWGDVFGDPVTAAAIADRLLHRAVVVNIRGPSWRLREHHALTQATRKEDHR
ncbi:MAG: IS21-like element helper ATPase IstB [Acidimicrobiia bacterium]